MHLNILSRTLKCKSKPTFWDIDGERDKRVLQNDWRSFVESVSVGWMNWSLNTEKREPYNIWLVQNKLFNVSNLFGASIQAACMCIFFVVFCSFCFFDSIIHMHVHPSHKFFFLNVNRNSFSMSPYALECVISTHQDWQWYMMYHDKTCYYLAV